MGTTYFALLIVIGYNLIAFDPLEAPEQVQAALDEAAIRSGEEDGATLLGAVSSPSIPARYEDTTPVSGRLMDVTLEMNNISQASSASLRTPVPRNAHFDSSSPSVLLQWRPNPIDEWFLFMLPWRKRGRPWQQATSNLAQEGNPTVGDAFNKVPMLSRYSPPGGLLLHTQPYPGQVCY